MLLSRKPTYKREVASITKMMSLLIIVKLIKQSCHFQEVKIKISRSSAKIIGTSADLKEGDVLTVESLMYGMMLPSGNDAAHAMAEHFGELLKEKKWAGLRDEDLKLLPGSYFS